MTNITLSIDDEIYKKMKKFSEVRWSELVRKVIAQRIKEMEKIKTEMFADEELLAKNWLSKEDIKDGRNYGRE